MHWKILGSVNSSSSISTDLLFPIFWTQHRGKTLAGFQPCVLMTNDLEAIVGTCEHLISVNNNFWRTRASPLLGLISTFFQCDTPSKGSGRIQSIYRVEGWSIICALLILTRTVVKYWKWIVETWPSYWQGCFSKNNLLSCHNQMVLKLKLNYNWFFERAL